MVKAAKTVSQIVTHTGIAFAVTYWLTGSIVFGGVAALIEAVINVFLLPFHERTWAVLRRIETLRGTPLFACALQKTSQTILHMAVAFFVMYWASGSLAFGRLAAVIEPICSVLLLPFHDRVWESIRAKFDTEGGRRLGLA